MTVLKRVPQLVIRFLREHGYDVLDTKKNLLRESDIKIIKIAQNEARIILTRDKDFIDLVKLPKYQVPTIIFRLEKLLENTKGEKIVKSLTVIEDYNTNFFSLNPNP